MNSSMSSSLRIKATPLSQKRITARAITRSACARTKRIRNYRKVLYRKTIGNKRTLRDIFSFFLKCVCISTGMVIISLISIKLYQEILRSPYFKVKHVQVEGCAKHTPAQILYLAGIGPQVNLLSLNLQNICQRLEDAPWIERATIRRILPDTLEISITERKAVALINLNQLYLVDQKGAIFKKAEREDGLALPVLTGISWQDLMNHQEINSSLVTEALTLMSMLEEKGISSSTLSEIHLDPTYGLTVFTTHSAIQIEMGFHPFQEKCARLGVILDDLREKSLTPQTINLNYRDKAFIKIKPYDEEDKSINKGGEKPWEKMGI